MKTKRLQLSIDIDTNDLLEKEIIELIRSEVKSKTREWFQQEIDEEINRMIGVRISKWTTTHGNHQFDTQFNKILNEKIDAAVKSCLDAFVVTAEMVKNRIDSKLGYIDLQINSAVKNKVDALNLNDFVSEYVRKRVDEVLTQEIVKIVAGKLYPVVTQNLAAEEEENA